jgi:hypothetical protein
MAEQLPHHVQEMSEAIVRALFPDLTALARGHITADAATFLLACIHRLELASATTSAVFALHGPPARSVLSLLFKAAKAVMKAVEPGLRSGISFNRISFAFVALQHKRNLAAHL